MNTTSQDNASAFLDAIINDEAMAERCKETDVSGRLAIAEKMGLPHTVDDLKAAIRDAFGHVFSPTVIDQLVEHIDGIRHFVAQLGGEERVMTAFFAA